MSEEGRPPPLDYARPMPKAPRGTHPLAWAVLGLFVVALLASVLMPTGIRSRAPANRVKCASNLRQIGQAIQLYSIEHGGQPPASIADLMEEDITSSVFICPSSNDSPGSGATTQATAADVTSGGHLSYVILFQELAKQKTADLVIAYEPLANHKNAGMNVLFADGHVEFIDAKAAAKMLAELTGGHNPPRAPTP